ncbi:MAG: S-layer homology domain-containing protein [Desulfatiglandales bacterium]
MDLSASATYRIALNDFMANGGDGYPNLGASGTGDVFLLQEPLELLVENYLADNSPVAPQVEDRIVSVCTADPTVGNGFVDVAGANPFCTDIAALREAGVMNGYADGTFRPTVATSRQAMAAFLYRQAGSPDGPFPEPEFSDVDTDHPFATEIAWMASEGLTEGYDDGTFRPLVPATRQATMAFLYRLAGSPEGPFPEPAFSDVEDTHPFATAIAWAAETGVTDGYTDGTFRPGAPSTRMATAALLNRS